MSSSVKLTNINGKVLSITNEDTNLTDITIDGGQIGKQVDTIADLRLMTETPSTVYVTGYHTANDGAFGSNFFKLVDSGTDNGGTIIVTAGGVYELQYSGAVNVKWFGAVGGGSTIDSDAINSAINSVEPDGGTVFIPDGVYVVQSTLAINASNVHIIGEGKNSRIVQTSDFGDIITIAEDTTALSGNSIRDIWIESQILTTSGSAILMDFCYNSIIDNVFITNTFDGLIMKGVTGSTINNVYLTVTNLYDGSGTGRTYAEFTSSNNVNASHPSCGDIYVTNSNFRGASTPLVDYGIVIRSADGLWFNNIHVGQTTVSNFEINSNIDDICDGVLVQNSWFDLCTGENIKFSGNTASVFGRFNFSNCIINGQNQGTNGVLFNGSCTAEDIVFQSCQILKHTNHGVSFIADFAGNAKIDNCIIMDNSYAGSGVANGVNIQDNVSNVTVSNCLIKGTNHATGIFATATGHSQVILDNNDVVDNISAMSLLYGTNIRQRENIGFNPLGAISGTPPTSGVAYTNPFGFNVTVCITGGTVTGISRDGANLSGFTSGDFLLGSGESITVTYSSAPKFYVFGV